MSRKAKRKSKYQRNIQQQKIKSESSGTGKWLRCRIEGVLTTLTPLHIGSGWERNHPELKKNDGYKTPVQVSAVAIDCNGRAYIPGSTLKGALRSWLEKNTLNDDYNDLFFRLFGKGGVNTADSLGGIAVFHDAPVIAPFAQESLPDWTYWNKQRQTVIECCNSIDRHTRTVKENHLFYREVVPAGVGFQVVISGSLTEKDIDFLLVVLAKAFAETDNALALGADITSNAGKVAWRLNGISPFSTKDLLFWLKRTDRLPLAEELAEKKREKVTVKRIKALEEMLLPACEYESFSIALQFDAFFLSGMIEQTENIDDKQRKISVSRTTLDEQKLILPASSFRGAFRSQAERILRTMAGSNGDGSALACDPLQKKAQTGCCYKIEDIREREKLCLICQLFGAPGWKSPIQISDFTMAQDDKLTWQSHRMIAVDRFTGAAKKSSLFTFRGGWRPRLYGTVRYIRNALPPGGLALLALTFRDLLEGDICFGYGRARGYGSCSWNTAETLWEQDDFRQAVKNDQKSLKEWIECRREV